MARAGVPMVVALGAAAFLCGTSSAQPAVTPEAGKIAFWRDQKHPCAIFTIDPDGTELRRITRWESSRDCSAPPVWSPDGTRIAFYARGALWVMNPDGAQRRKLAAADYAESGGPGPSWSPDGRRLVFNLNPDAHRNASAVYTVQVDGKELRRLTPERFAEAPQWSPDGTRIAFKSDVTNEGELVVTRPDGTHRRRLTENDDVEESFAWAPDGSKLAFLTTNLYSIDPTGTRRRLLTAFADAHRPGPGLRQKVTRGRRRDSMTRRTWPTCRSRALRTLAR